MPLLTRMSDDITITRKGPDGTSITVKNPKGAQMDMLGLMGGMVEGSSPTPVADNVKANLTAGEFVVNQPAAQKYKGLLQQINNEGRQELDRMGYAEGGDVAGELPMQQVQVLEQLFAKLENAVGSEQELVMAVQGLLSDPQQLMGFIGNAPIDPNMVAQELQMLLQRVSMPNEQNQQVQVLERLFARLEESASSEQELASTIQQLLADPQQLLAFIGDAPIDPKMVATELNNALGSIMPSQGFAQGGWTFPTWKPRFKTDNGVTISPHVNFSDGLSIDGISGKYKDDMDRKWSGQLRWDDASKSFIKVTGDMGPGTGSFKYGVGSGPEFGYKGPLNDGTFNGLLNTRTGKGKVNYSGTTPLNGWDNWDNFAGGGSVGNNYAAGGWSLPDYKPRYNVGDTTLYPRISFPDDNLSSGMLSGVGGRTKVGDYTVGGDYRWDTDKGYLGVSGPFAGGQGAVKIDQDFNPSFKYGNDSGLSFNYKPNSNSGGINYNYNGFSAGVDFDDGNPTFKIGKRWEFAEGGPVDGAAAPQSAYERAMREAAADPYKYILDLKEANINYDDAVLTMIRLLHPQGVTDEQGYKVEEMIAPIYGQGPYGPFGGV